MSLADWLGLKPRRVLHAAMGSEALECAVATGHGRSLSWVEGTYRRFALVASALPAGTSAAVATGALAASAPNTALAASATSEALAPAPWGDAIAALAADTPALQADALRVVVADCWLSVGSSPWSSASHHRFSAEADARARMTIDGFALDPQDTLRIDDGGFAEPQLTVAYPQALIDAWSGCANRLGMPLVSISPLSAAAWVAAARNGAKPVAAAVVGDGFAMLLRALGKSGRLSEVTMRADLPGSGPAAQRLRELWRRSGLRDPQMGDIARLPTLDMTQSQTAAAQLSQPFAAIPLSPGTAGPVAAPSALLRLAAAASQMNAPVDAIAASAQHRPLRWATAAAALGIAAAVGLQAVRTYEARQDLLARVAAAAGVVAPAPARPQPWSQEERARVQAVNVAVRELNLPVAALLRALQPPRDLRVAVLSVETTEHPPNAPAMAGSIRIVAETRGSADMARYAAHVADSRPFTTAYVVRHEVDDAVAERPYRFTLEASWAE